MRHRPEYNWQSYQADRLFPHRHCTAFWPQISPAAVHGGRGCLAVDYGKARSVIGRSLRRRFRDNGRKDRSAGQT